MKKPQPGQLPGGLGWGLGQDLDNDLGNLGNLNIPGLA